ncbi:DUF551 domain-containing protein [Klebsiella pneumoniae]|uniref:DUF551 domain-containing protein n=1 Tax=Klebsiella pneumoniae TaxID=573 RepID=UPI001B8AF6F1|nr:DUF551 domain-containing protein [Klebsiella pneumoniae]MBR7316949.1 DUF551 domain-containing protein [Klebsiella pneumoniae]
MTKSAITRERLEWLSQISCRDDIEDIGGDEIRELASMALAAMDSEPVAYTEKHEISNMHATGLYLRAWPADRARNAVEGYTIPLYRHAQPAPVVPGWIPVSERMPEFGVKVLCFPAEDEPIHAVFNGQLWLQDVSWSGSEEPIDNVIPVTVTHWMPLPAGPQEVR